MSRHKNFNPRPPCGGRQTAVLPAKRGERFQSTPPVRGATQPLGHGGGVGKDFNPRPPCGGRRFYSLFPRCDFNPRPPCGGRRSSQQKTLPSRRFQSTPPVRGATNKGNTPGGKKYISIHAPRAGGDQFLNPLLSVHKISIHAPRAGGDSSFVGDGVEIEISIHAPRAGGD